MISDGDDFGNENGILMANLNDEDSRYNIVQRRKECVFSKTQVVTSQWLVSDLNPKEATHLSYKPTIAGHSKNSNIEF